MASHVPAWKRLGLKLKYAKEEPAIPPQSSAEQTNGIQKRSRDVEELPRQPKTKKLRTHAPITNGVASSDLKDHNEPPVHGIDANASDGSHAELDQDKQGQEIQPKKLKKSVSFTNDTKVPEGVTDQASAETITKTTKSAKKFKKENGASSTLRKSQDGLDYLTLYASNRRVWKFQKNREVWVLKHALSTNDIPSDHNAALAQYIHSIRGQKARARLIQECRASLAKQPAESENEDADESDEFRTRFLQRLKKGVDDDDVLEDDKTDEQYVSWLKTRKREQLLLDSMGASNRAAAPSGPVRSKYLPDEPTLPTKPASDAKPKEKKKKNRTAVVEYSSSSSSESESESESENKEDTSSSGSGTHSESDSESVKTTNVSPPKPTALPQPSTNAISPAQQPQPLKKKKKNRTAVIEYSSSSSESESQGTSSSGSRSDSE